MNPRKRLIFDLILSVRENYNDVDGVWALEAITELMDELNITEDDLLTYEAHLDRGEL